MSQSDLFHTGVYRFIDSFRAARFDSLTCLLVVGLFTSLLFSSKQRENDLQLHIPAQGIDMPRRSAAHQREEAALAVASARERSTSKGFRGSRQRKETSRAAETGKAASKLTSFFEMIRFESRLLVIFLSKPKYLKNERNSPK